MNVGGSVKDRAAKAMLLKGIESGRLAAFERECTKRGVPPVTANIAGGNFILWRGIPIIPTDKLLVDGLKNPKSKSGKTNILLIRTGEAKRGVIGLYQANLKNEQSRGLSVRYRGIDDKGVASYLLSLYCSAAILSDDATEENEKALRQLGIE